MEHIEKTAVQEAKVEQALAETERSFKRLQRDVGELVQKRPVQIALLSCAGVGAIAGGAALISRLRDTPSRRARSWFGHETTRAKKRARAFTSSGSHVAPNTGLITAGALLGAGLTLLWSRQRAANSTHAVADAADKAAEVASPLVPDYH